MQLVCKLFLTTQSYNYTKNFKPMPVDYDHYDQTSLKVKFNNVYVFPYPTMYKPNTFPTSAAEQPTARRPLRPSKKRGKRQNTPPVAKPLQPAQPVQPVQPLQPVPPVQSARTLRASQRVARKAR